MARQTTGGPTRRDVLKKGGAVLGVGTLAGCTGASSSDDTGSDTQNTSGGGGNSYSVTMSPVGNVEFDEPPERWVPYTGGYADMGVTLGQANGLEAIGVRDRFATYVYDELSDVSVNKEDLTQLWQSGTDKEVFYELDADIHLIDPNFMINQLQWDHNDIDEIEENVAPFFGNTIFSHRYEWHDYRYYTMYEVFERIAAVFKEQPRYQAFKQLHDDVLSDIQPRLPKETPSVAVLVPKSEPPEVFYPYPIGEGAQFKQWNDLRVNCALTQHGIASAQVSGGTIGYETLLEIDPDVIAIRQQGGITQDEFERNIVSYMHDHPIASELQAVNDDRVIRGGLTFQGPTIHLFQLEMAAQGVYPEIFTEKQLFDRQRVADIINGDI